MLIDRFFYHAHPFLQPPGFVFQGFRILERNIHMQPVKDIEAFADDIAHSLFVPAVADRLRRVGAPGDDVVGADLLRRICGGRRAGRLRCGGGCFSWRAAPPSLRRQVPRGEPSGDQAVGLHASASGIGAGIRRAWWGDTGWYSWLAHITPQPPAHGDRVGMSYAGSGSSSRSRHRLVGGVAEAPVAGLFTQASSVSGIMKASTSCHRCPGLSYISVIISSMPRNCASSVEMSPR